VTIEFTFKVEPDENGIFDGRELARHFVGSAYRLLVPYVSACPACADNLFSAIANGVIDQLHREGSERGKMEGFFMSTRSGDERDAGERASERRTAAITNQPTSACGAPLWVKMVAARAGLSESLHGRSC
jgi:hypothetical protein